MKFYPLRQNPSIDVEDDCASESSGRLGTTQREKSASIIKEATCSLSSSECERNFKLSKLLHCRTMTFFTNDEVSTPLCVPLEVP